MRSHSPVSPESHLQLALDRTYLSDNEELVVALRDRLARVEVGTPLLMGEGLRAVERVKGLAAEGSILIADTKICDAGARIAAAALGAGADVVTVVAAAIDDETWHGVVQAASAAATAGRPAPSILIDAIGWDVDKYVLAEWCRRAWQSGVKVEVCVHRPKANPPAFAALIDEILLSDFHSLEYLVAGKMTADVVAPALDAGFGSLIVGGAIANSKDPIAEWMRLIGAVEEQRMRVPDPQSQPPHPTQLTRSAQSGGNSE